MTLSRQMLDRPWDFPVSSSSQPLLNFHKKVSQAKDGSWWKQMLMMLTVAIIAFIWNHLKQIFRAGLALLCVQCTSEESSDCMVNIWYSREKWKKSFYFPEKIILDTNRYAKNRNINTCIHQKTIIIQPFIWSKIFGKKRNCTPKFSKKISLEK